MRLSRLLPVLIAVLAACSPILKDKTATDIPAVTVSDRISNLNITAFAEDAWGHIWIATNYGLNRYTGHEFYQYYQGEADNTLNNNSTTSFLLDRDGRLWVTTTSGVCRFNGDDTFTRIPVHTTMVACNRLVQLDDGEILVHTSFSEWLLYDPETETFNLISSSDSRLREVPEEQTLDPTAWANEVPFRPTVAYRDSRGNVWVGSSGHGFQIISSHQPLFNRDRNLCASVQDVNIISLTQDGRGGLWMAATEDRLFLARDNHTQALALPAGISGLQTIYCIPERDELWIGAGNSLIRCQAGEKLHVRERIELAGSVRSFASDGEGTLYAGLSNGSVFVWRPDATQLIQLPSNRLVYDLKVLRDGSLWITQFREAISIWYPDTNLLKTLDYREDVGEAYHLQSILEAENGDVYFPTRDFGMLCYRASDQHFLYIDGFSSQRLTAIAPAGQGAYWVSSIHGLNLWHPEEGKIVPFYTQSGLGGDQFNGRSVCVLPDGTVVFGGTHGITTCHDIQSTGSAPAPLLFENILVNGIHAPAEAWEGDLYDGPQIRLKYNQNTITLSYASLDYPQSGTSWYVYELEGFDKMPYLAGNNYTARYSNLPAGKYRFHLWRQSALNDSPQEAILPITILPAPWQGPWAIAAYILFFVGLSWFVIHIVSRNIRLKMAVEQSRREKEHEQYVNRMSMNFFANMAHEFRTPLTMISGPIAQLREDPDVGDAQKRTLGIVQLSVDRMLRLASHLLDFNKLDTDTLELRPVPGLDVTELLRKTVDLFRINAKRFGLRIETEGLDRNCRADLDPDQLESIVENLLSNAFKYTDRRSGEGWVALRLAVAPDGMKVLVENNGDPISEENLAHLFDRFYQIREHTDNQRTPGTGIGLYYAKALAVKMGGDLTAENLEGRVRFTLTLPVAVTEAAQDVDSPSQNANSIIEEEEAEAENGSNKRTVLVVDDDPDLANYLSMIFSPYYRVLCAYDADSAAEIAVSGNMPDLVLSDIVMSGTDGIALCKSLKNNLVTCHIPVILVTAKVGVENEVEGLESGADAYVTKPFDPDYLLALIRSIFRNRDLLKGELTSSTDIVQINASLLSTQDREFMNMLYQLMEKEIANPDFDIQNVAERMLVSRSKLFYKVRNLTGMSPLHLFRTYRLNVAANLLKTGKYNVSEVADKVGFVSLSYFSKSFKQQFGILPKDAIRN